MKDKIKLLLNKITLCGILFFTATCLCGCVNTDTTITIDRKGNATLEEKTLFSSEIMDYIDKELSSKISEIESRNDPNFTIEEISEDSKSGVKITEIINNIKENDISYDDLFLHEVIKTQLESERLVDVNKTFFTTSYDFNFDIAWKKDVDLVKTKITINIPVKAKTHNATSIDEKKHSYTWKITEPEHNISLSYSTVNIGAVVVCCLPILALLILCIIVLLLNSKSNSQNTKKCPICGEMIAQDAKKCEFCGERLDEENIKD